MVLMANTVGYMVAGFVVIFTGMAAYLLSLGLRWRKLKSDLHVLEKDQKE
jgi:CcmD family protein